MVLGAYVGSTLGYSINKLHGLALENYFGTWEVYLVGVSLGTLDGFITGMGEWYLVGLSLGLPLGYPLDSTNPGLPGIILDVSFGNPLGYLLDSIWYINWCGPWVSTWKFHSHFNGFTSLLFS